MLLLEFYISVFRNSIGTVCMNTLTVSEEYSDRYILSEKREISKSDLGKFFVEDYGSELYITSFIEISEKARTFQNKLLTYACKKFLEKFGEELS